MKGVYVNKRMKHVLAIVMIVAIVVTSLPVSMQVRANEVIGSEIESNIAITATATAICDLVNDLGGVKALNNNVEPEASLGIGSDPIWHCWGYEGQKAFVQYTWDNQATITSSSVYYFTDNGGILLPSESKFEYYDEASSTWIEAATVYDNKLDQYNRVDFITPIVTKQLRITMIPQNYGTETNNAVGIREWKVIGTVQEGPGKEPDENEVTVQKTAEGYKLSNSYFTVETGKYGNISSLKIKNDLYDTNYVMNAANASAQASAAGHQWLGELMFKVRSGDATEWSEENTGRSDSGRMVELIDNKVVVTYENATEEKGIKSFKLVETYSLEANGKLRWEITVTNTKEQDLVIGDFGIPLAFNEYWPGGEEIYETRTVDHSFVGKDSSYVYVTRPSGLGKFLVLTPDVSTGAGFEYQDHWRTDERSSDEKTWCQDQAGWANGLNVFYIHSDVIKSTNRGYLDNTSLTLSAGEAKTYAFNFSVADNEETMKTILYNEGIIDAVAVPGMTYAINMPGKLYLHTTISKDDISFEIQCPHETALHVGNDKTISNNLHCNKTESNTYANYVETKIVDGEQYHIYDIKFADLGQNNIVIYYNGGQQETTLQFYIMDDVATTLETHSEFMVDKTQINTPGKTGDKVFDDWMMDNKDIRANTETDYWTKSYWGWGDDWGLTHGEYIAEKNVYQPVAKEIEAVDQYLDVAIWNGLMREHQQDYKIHDFLVEAPNTSPDGRGYAYPHIYNTYFSMYKIAKNYPNTIEYIEEANTYLLRAYRILKALYSDGVGYNWETGLMGELTTPDIIAALEEEGYYEEAQNVITIMATKYDNFKNTKYPYGSEYSYDNTGEEAVYTLAKVNLETDTANASSMMDKINAKTRACRGIQPVWYHYANPTTICGENWWNFQYTASLAGYCMDDWLRIQNNGMTEEEMAEASRVNYAAKLANLTCINSGQMDADPENIGAASWTYQSEMGNLGGQGTGGGNLHNGWRQMTGEADLGLFGALQILSSDVVIDPIFGLFGYGCEVMESGDTYVITPLDGLYTRLNLINNKLYIELDRDQYTQAIVDKNNSLIELTMKNIEKTEHETTINLTGLNPGSYQMQVNGTVVGSFQAVAGMTSTVTIPLPQADTATVKVEAAVALANKEPIVDAGEDKVVELSEKVRLVGKATDDGYVNATLTYKWEVESTPEGGEAVITSTDKRISDVSFSMAGTYILKFTADDGEYKKSDTVTYIVNDDSDKPLVMADYTFESISDDKKYVMTDTGEAYYGLLTYNPQIIKENNDDRLKMTGKISGGYVELPHTLTNLVTNATISVDVKLSDDQLNRTTLFEFGSDCVVEFVNGNEIAMTVKGNTINTGVALAPGYLKNIEITVELDHYKLYVDGVLKGELKNTGLVLKDIPANARYFIGRSAGETEPFLNALVDNFVMKSYAMTAKELEDAYGSTEKREILSAKSNTVITQVGSAPEMPTKVSALYSDGVYEQVEVSWDSIPKEQYSKAGDFTVEGTVKGMSGKVSTTVIVVSGTLQNVAIDATASAIINSVNDLGGVVGLNDGFDPKSSMDTSHGVWHNWLGNQGAAAWVQYDWSEPQIIAGMDAYFFKDGGGNFAPANYTIEYLGEDGNWYSVKNGKGLGVEINKYNKTTFDPISTRALRMTMMPASLGCGVIEWKVYGYKDSNVIDKSKLNTSIAMAEGLDQKLFTSGLTVMNTALVTAKEIAANRNVTQLQVDDATQNLMYAIAELTPVIENNIAYNASVSTSFISSWEKLSAVNDGKVSKVSNSNEVPHYGTWGNLSPYETVTYTWGVPMKISSSDVYFWTDGGGIQIPESYLFEYIDKNGDWKSVENANGYEVLKKRTDDETEELNLDGFNTTTFDEISTTSIRITIMKPSENSDGVGLVEWRVFGMVDNSVKDNLISTQLLNEALALVPEKEASAYTTESYKAFTQALLKAKEVATDSQATAERKREAAANLTKAYQALQLKSINSKPDQDTSNNVEKEEKNIILDKNSETIYQGMTTTIQVKEAPEGRIVWSSSDESIATVEKGVVTGVSTGTAKITAAVGDKTAMCTIRVTQLGKVNNTKLISSGSTSMNLSWDTVAEATGYYIYRYNGSKWGKIATVNTTSYVDKKLSSNKNYSYRVQAYKKVGVDTLVGDFSDTIKSKTGPGKIINLKIKKISATFYNLSWKKSAGATGYEIYQKINEGKYKKIKTLDSKTMTYTIKGLKSGKSYTFYVRAIQKKDKLTSYGTKAYTKSIAIK